MDRQELKDYMLKYYGLRTNQIREELAREELQYLYRLRPVYQNQLRVGRRHRDEMNKGPIKWVYALTGKQDAVRKERKQLYKGTKERYRSFSDLVFEKEKRYLQLKENHASDIQNIRAMERRLLDEDSEMVASVKREIENQFTASAIQVGKALSVHVFKTMEKTKLKSRWNATQAAQKHSPLRLSYGYDSQKGYLDHLIRMFREELTLLNTLFDKDWNVTFLKQMADPLLRRQHLKMESEDAQSMVKELEKLHKKTEKMLSRLQKEVIQNKEDVGAL